MNQKDTIEQVILIPRVFKEFGSTTVFNLLQNTGYFELHGQISENDIYETILNFPECINDWMHFSEDKRSSAGWYFRITGMGYEVGYFGTTPNSKPMQFLDKVKACAAFITYKT
jgi:hypothetical protein